MAGHMQTVEETRAIRYQVLQFIIFIQTSEIRCEIKKNILKLRTAIEMKLCFGLQNVVEIECNGIYGIHLDWLIVSKFDGCHLVWKTPEVVGYFIWNSVVLHSYSTQPFSSVVDFHPLPTKPNWVASLFKLSHPVELIILRMMNAASVKHFMLLQR